MPATPDMQCTWWPDTWFGVSITPCCRAHDLGGTHTELAACVLHTLTMANPWLALPAGLLAVVMWAGVAGPPGMIYRRLRGRE